jgi:hypothetical protein
MSYRSGGFGARGRLIVGALFLLFVWICFIVRAIWGLGFMQDLQGNPAPTLHYLIGALAVTAMVLAWNIGMRIWEKQRQQ